MTFEGMRESRDAELRLSGSWKKYYVNNRGDARVPTGPAAYDRGRGVMSHCIMSGVT